MSFAFEGVRAARGNATCVFCRASVASAAPAAGSSRAKPSGSARISEGYINLAAEAGISPVRDTSSCKDHVCVYICESLLTFHLDYHGPRRGARYYGYQNYDDDFFV